jgi:hypothetical protein
MTKWEVAYKGPDGKPRFATVNLQGYESAQEVKDAIEKGKVSDLYITPGAIVSVARIG